MGLFKKPAGSVSVFTTPDPGIAQDEANRQANAWLRSALDAANKRRQRIAEIDALDAAAFSASPSGSVSFAAQPVSTPRSEFSGAYLADNSEVSGEDKVRAVHAAIMAETDAYRAELERQEAANLAEYQRFAAARRREVARRKTEDEEADMMIDAFRESGIIR